MRGPRRQDGFTLIELILVFILIAILAAIAIPVYTHFLDKARAIRSVAEIRGIEKEIMMYVFDVGVLPVTLQQLKVISLEDPWGNAYRYVNPGLSGPGAMRRDRFSALLNTDYDLYSTGADGKSQLPLSDAASWDDIVRANDGEYIGLASLY
jgi:general secretion pathway protein G